MGPRLLLLPGCGTDSTPDIHTVTATDLSLFKSRLKTHFVRLPFTSDECSPVCFLIHVFIYFNTLQHCCTVFYVLRYGFVVKHFGSYRFDAYSRHFQRTSKGQ